MAGDLDTDSATSAAPSLTTAAAQANAKRSGTLQGRCVDEAGLPVAAVSILATSLEHQGKLARFCESTASDADGRFLLKLPVNLDSGQEYSIATRHMDFVSHLREGALVRTDQSTDLGSLALLHSSHDAPGEVDLEINVLDGNGAPLQHALVSALRQVLDATGKSVEEIEHSARTDANGRARLALHRLGNKWILVQPPAGEWGPLREAIAIDAPGPYARTLSLQRGLTISGTIAGIGGEVVHGQGGFLAAWGDPMQSWIFADCDDRSGRFVLSGLEDRSYTLVRGGDGWSYVEFENVRAGTSGLSILLKRADDARDVGDHLAELHGVVHDSASGAVLPIGAFSMSALPIGEFDGTDFERDILPTLIVPRPVQTAMFAEYVPPSAFHLVGLKPGQYTISARIEGYAVAFSAPIRLAANEVRSGFVIEVAPAAVLRGVLVDPAGRPLAGGFARITGFGPRSAERDRSADAVLRSTLGNGAIDVWDEVRCDARGRFEIKGLPAGVPLRLALHHPEHAPAYSTELELRPGTIGEVGAIRIGAKLSR